jgi:hypothetical protein
MRSPPAKALMTLVANSAPAYAIESVADPAPSLALTTSSPPYWMRFVSASSFSVSSEAGSGWELWERRGTIYHVHISKIDMRGETVNIR